MAGLRPVLGCGNWAYSNDLRHRVKEATAPKAETIVIPNATKPPQMPPTRRRSDGAAA